MKRAFIIAFVATVLIVAWFTNSNSDDDVGLNQSILHNGISRDYILYIPENLPTNAPLVVVSHGYTSSAKTMMSYSGMNKVADEEKFLVVYPQGTKDQRGNNFFNVGYEFHASSKVDDLGFIKALAIKLTEDYQVNPNHIFATGMSNGGDLSYFLACYASDTFQAVAPIAGTMMQTTIETCKPQKGMPIFAVHGKADEVTYFDGDMANRDKWGPYPGIPAVIEHWVDVNAVEISKQVDLDNITNFTASNEALSFDRYLSETSDHEVWLYIHSGGHDWSLKELDTSSEIWSFFTRYIN
ncbi:prolyl oligopeptidase family serine peptidase [Gammaproteobacteria bacterium]|nr:prolyl oligopeptidase family serine peptidase [Gammaproteobacteria bacterium]